MYGLFALLILVGCFWVLSQVLTRIPMGVAYAICLGLRRWLVILSATPHHHAHPVHRVGRCGCNRLEPIKQSGFEPPQLVSVGDVSFPRLSESLTQQRRRAIPQMI
jgi:hypothetical protein